MRGSLLLFAILLVTTPSPAAELKCEISQKYICETTGCRTAPTNVWNLVNTTKKTYARCDRMGCDKYDALFSQSDVFVNIALPERGVIAKMAVDASSFHEVTTLAHSVYVSFGSCQATNGE
jgi:hypothetical protein